MTVDRYRLREWLWDLADMLAGTPRFADVTPGQCSELRCRIRAVLDGEGLLSPAETARARAVLDAMDAGERLGFDEWQLIIDPGLFALWQDVRGRDLAEAG